MGKDKASCTLCSYFRAIGGRPTCTKRPKVHERDDFPFKDTDCVHYRYILDFSRLYNRGPVAPGPED